MTEPDTTAAGGSDRRALVVGGVVALVLALGAGSMFGLLSMRSTSDPGAGTTGEQETERAVATLPQPDDEPEPVDDHFPAIDGLEEVEADDAQVAGLEERLRPVDAEFADTRHRELHADGEPVALISLLRVSDDEEAALLRREALDGLGDLFDQVGDAEVADEAVVHARNTDGTALLWLPDTLTVVVVLAVEQDRAEAVLGAVVGSVRGQPDEDDDEVATAGR